MCALFCHFSGFHFTKKRILFKKTRFWVGETWLQGVSSNFNLYNAAHHCIYLSLYYSTLHCNTLHCTAPLHCLGRQCSALHAKLLNCIALYCTALTFRCKHREGQKGRMDWRLKVMHCRVVQCSVVQCGEVNFGVGECLTVYEVDIGEWRSFKEEELL